MFAIEERLDGHAMRFEAPTLDECLRLARAHAGGTAPPSMDGPPPALTLTLSDAGPVMQEDERRRAAGRGLWGRVMAGVVAQPVPPVDEAFFLGTAAEAPAVEDWTLTVDRVLDLREGESVTLPVRFTNAGRLQPLPFPDDDAPTVVE